MRLGSIVEGHGEVEALPVLLRRIAAEFWPAVTLETLKPFRVPKGRLVKKDELQRAVEWVARRLGPRQPILLLLDADDDCPVELASRLLPWAREQRNDRALAVVVAKREYESWLISAAESLHDHLGALSELGIPSDPEAIRGAKAWLDARMPSGYVETVDQPKLTARMDLSAARRAPSFDKLLREVGRLLNESPSDSGDLP